MEKTKSFIAKNINFTDLMLFIFIYTAFNNCIFTITTLFIINSSLFTIKSMKTTSKGQY